MTKRMLIDDTQPEETRVVVVNGNKVEDVEFESSSRRQIKSNIYLAKVMRVEPSLQAAFVDYGGNRHGFLAFGEIHPDYYNISEKAMADLEKEIENTIENKKQAIKEREQERTRIREDKAAKRTQRMEQEAVESNSVASTQQESVVDSEALATETTTNSENTSETEIATDTSATEEKKIRSSRNRRGRRPRNRREDNSTSQENSSETTTENTPISADNGNSEVKTFAETAGIKTDRVQEKDNNRRNDDEGDDLPRERYSANGGDDELAADDDDDDNEYDFEIQKKLILMRKLFHQNKIQDVIKEGQILLVQVVKEERGNKGAALTTYLSLAGRYCVLMPNRIKSGGVSRKITNVSDRKRLKSIIKELPISSDMSLIVRTAGEEKTKSDIIRDYNYLVSAWDQVRIDSLKSVAPTLIYEEGNLIKRALRDMFTKEISEIIVDGDNAYQAARSLMKMLSPHSMKKLKSCKPNDIPLFQRFQIENQLDKLHDTNVQLESGGYLVINPTEALVSIDVNSGRATKEKDLEETALRTNLEAADEIAKQLRMRNLAGLVVIDFIDMDEPKNNQAIEKRMKEAMKKDRARVQIGKMSCFGLLEISRQRMHSSFFESNYQTCPHCHGRGIIRTIESGAISILRTIEEEGNKNRSAKIIISLPRDIAVYLLNQKRQDLVTIEQRYKMQVIVSADESIKNIADYKIERIRMSGKPVEDTARPVAIVSELFEDPTSDTPQVEDEANKSVVSKEDNKEKGENTDNRKNSENNDDDNYRRRGRRDRRYRYDRRRNGYRNPDGSSQEDNNNSSSEPETLHNHYEGITSSEGNDNKGEKRKVAWWKKLING